MGNNPKLFISGKAYFASSRMEEGLPLLPYKIINTIIWGIASRAQRLYPVEIVGMLFMANHFHLCLVAIDPQAVSDFFRYMKAELGHAVNRMLGRRKHTVWEAGYDSPIVLTAPDVMRYLVYLYSNPVSAELIDSIDQYPGVSTWEMFDARQTSKKARWIRRSAIPLLADQLSEADDQALTQQLLLDCPIEQTFTLAPFSWMKCFRCMQDVSVEEMRKKLLAMIRTEEMTLRTLRFSEGRTVMGPQALKSQSIRTPYSPNKFTPRMICLCSDVELRIEYILWFRSLVRKSREAFALGKDGNVTVAYPPGFFPPRGKVQAHWLPSAFIT